uniref:EF-hand domain-containing protein n=1 Tax=Haptolina ericina TaxID=156174 RepID=A0A7S3FLN0_9EUKA|mmetsp:Transcript_72836/g.161846  ORF Transcript_72836/g.161846 Transcript_72836/m.161846 type:complete len:124 (+) Transcript_72836:351-722(+)
MRAQWDVDDSGALDFSEIQRGFLAAGIEPSDWAAAFDALDGNGDNRITFEEFEANLGADERRKIEARLNEEGTMRSMYVPPEKWVETRSAEEMRWEAKVRQEAQRDGNRLRQNDILSNELGKG